MVDRESAVTELEALMPPPDATDAPPPDDLYAKVQAARARWVQGPELPRHTLAPLAERVNAALFSLVTRWPDGFKGTDLDPEQTKGRMEKLIAKVEKQLPTESVEPAKNLSPAELLARQWREALAANTMGAGRVAPGGRRATARRRAGSAQRAVGVGAARSARARSAQAAAGAFRSRGPQVLRDASPLHRTGVTAASGPAG